MLRAMSTNTHGVLGWVLMKSDPADEVPTRLDARHRQRRRIRRRELQEGGQLGDLPFRQQAALTEVGHACERTVAQDRAEAVRADLLGPDLADVGSGGAHPVQPVAPGAAVEVGVLRRLELLGRQIDRWPSGSVRFLLS